MYQNMLANAHHLFLFCLTGQRQNRISLRLEAAQDQRVSVQFNARSVLRDLPKAVLAKRRGGERQEEGNFSL